MKKVHFGLIGFIIFVTGIISGYLCFFSIRLINRLEDSSADIMGFGILSTAPLAFILGIFGIIFDKDKSLACILVFFSFIVSIPVIMYIILIAIDFPLGPPP